MHYGRHQVNAAEHQANAIQAIQVIPPGSSSPIYISYRQPIGTDVNLPSQFTGGATIHLWNGGSAKTQLPWKGVLVDGQAYTSSDGHVTITQLSHGAANVTVEITFSEIVHSPPRR